MTSIAKILFKTVTVIFLICWTTGQTLRDSISSAFQVQENYTTPFPESSNNTLNYNATDDSQSQSIDSTISGSRFLCNFVLYDGEGNFSSYDYPNPYKENLDCTYQVKRVDDSCHLEVTFADFNIQDDSGEQCYNDFLLINGKKYCGTSWKGKTELIPFPKDSEDVTFLFHSDGQISGGGFWISVMRFPDACSLPVQDICNKGYVEEEFNLHSPGFPEDYINNQECLFHIIKHSKDVCGLELTFLSFDIEPSDNCAYDYLEVSGKRLCGSISTNAVRVFMFSDDEILIRFNSDNQNTRKGFNIKAKQISRCYPDHLELSTVALSSTLPSCNVFSSAVEDEFISWGYPTQYANNLSCLYTVLRADEQYCHVQLDFDDFDLEYDIECMKDFLQIEGQRNCGTSLNGQKRSVQFDDKGTIVFMFETDSNFVKKGFKVRILQTLCLSSITHSPTAPSTSCGDNFKQQEFYIQSPDYPSNYSSDVDCEYVIHRKDTKTCALEVTFHAFDIESSKDCQKDYFEIEGEKYCGRLPENVVRTFPLLKAEKVIKFHTDSDISGPGYILHVTQQECDPRSAATSNEECKVEIRESEFEIKSPNYPRAYDNDLSCQYIVHRSSNAVCELALNIQDFKLQEGEVCENDYVQISEERLCGNINKGTIRTYNFRMQEMIVLRFETDGSLTERGFILNGKQRNCDATDQPPWLTSTSLPAKPLWAQSPKCDKVVNEPEVLLNSPEYPSNYPDNADCQFQINRINARYCELEITINNLHIQVGDSCQFDYLEVDGHRFCGSTSAGNKRIFTFKTGKIIINFHSDSSITDRGFEVMLKQRECATLSTTPKPSVKSCDEVFDSKDFTLISPNFPDDYDNNADCKFIIRRSDDNVCKLEMFFLAFDVESSSECEYDYLLINGEKICGIMENVTRTYLFQDYEKVLTFHSDSGTSRPGFMIHVQQIECLIQTTEPPLPLKPCNKRFSSSLFEIQSENHPSHYDNNLNCIYTIVPSNREICSLDLTFLTFDVEASDGCQYDYLEIEQEKLCGVYPTNLKRNIKFNRQEIALKFHSDGATARPGFHVKIQQLECSSGIAPPQSPVSPSVSCNKQFSKTSGTFSSPQFPHFYSKDIRCVYTFIGQSGFCRVILNFLEFNVATRNSICEQDFLEINGIKYCGPQLLGQTRTLTFYGSPREINITFQSDEDVEEKGFYASYKQLPCVVTTSAKSPIPDKQLPRGTYVPSCDRLYASLKFDIISPNHPENYPVSKNCRYTIRRISAKICKLHLNFVLFDVESSNECNSDYLEIDGHKVCGTLTENTNREYDLREYQMVLKFHSDAANTRSGFIIKVEQLECNSKQTQELHPPSRDTHPPLIDIESSVDEAHFPYPPLVTLEDYDHVFEHPHHPYPPQKVPPPEAISSFDYRNCDRIFHKEEFEIRSVNFPLNYPNSLNCRYIVKRANPHICWVKLNFIRFDVESSEDCQYDYLSINNKRICGTLSDDEMRAYIFTSDELSMYFRSDSAVSRRGFMIRGEQLPCHTSSTSTTTAKPVIFPSCSQNHDKDLFVIQSPGFPENYPNSVDCQYSIKKASRYICGLELTLLTFDIENSVDCENDYLLVNGKKLCGPIPSKTTKRFPFIGASMMISFHSNMEVTRPGFSILVKQEEDCLDYEESDSLKDCNQSLYMERFILESPSFPDDYPANKTCHYIIHRSNTDVCGLEVSVLSFDLEEKIEDQCDNDYLELSPAKRLCGNLQKGHTELLPFDEDVLKLVFHSDFVSQRTGFSLQIQQKLECSSSRTKGEQTVAPPIISSSAICDQTFMTKEFSIRSPNFPSDYPNDMTCKYTIFPAEGKICALELWFAHFDIEDGPECSYDYFDIGYKSICGHLPSGFSRVVPFDTPSKMFVFHSDKGTSRTGFAIKIKQLSDCTLERKPGLAATIPPTICDQHLKGTRSHLTSPNYPDDYAENLKCIYHIQRSKGFCGLELYFHDFHLEHSQNCSKDFLIVDEKKYCGLELKRKIIKMNFPLGESNEISLSFRTDINGGATGFHIEYRQIPCRGYPWHQDRNKKSFDWKQDNDTYLPFGEPHSVSSELKHMFVPLSVHSSQGFSPFTNTTLKDLMI